MSTHPPIDVVDRRLLEATQAGLPLCRTPYRQLAESLGLTPEATMARLVRLLDIGAVRRIGAVPNHYALGYRANGMAVWDIPDEAMSEVGPQVGALDYVSHCYWRPRHLPIWPYNLFAMVHGKDRDEVVGKVTQINALLGTRSRLHKILFSTRILKKTGLRLTS